MSENIKSKKKALQNAVLPKTKSTGGDKAGDMDIEKDEEFLNGEAKYRALVDNATDFIFLIDKNFRVLTANKAAARLFGRDAAQWIGRSVSDLFPQGIAGDYVRDLKRAFETGKAGFFEKKMIVSGREFWTSVSLSPVKNTRGETKAVMGVTRDITERKMIQEELVKQNKHMEELIAERTAELKHANETLQRYIADREKAERALSESKEKYHNLFQQSNDAIFVHDLQGNIIDANQKATELFGYSKSEILSLKISKLHPEYALGKSRLAFESVEHTGAVFFEVDFRKKNGEVFPAAVSSSMFEAKGQKLVQGLVRDITDQRKAEQIQSVLFNITQATSSAESLEELLQIIHQQLGTLIDTTNFYVALYNSETELYSFPFVVDEYEQDDTFSPQELKKSLTDYVRRTGKALLADERIHRELIASGEVDLVGADSKVWMGAPLRTQEGVIGVVAVQSYSNDVIYSTIDMEILAYISEHIAMAIYRKRTERKILASLKEKDVLLKEIHHRVKNNMQIISSLLRLQSRGIENEKARKIFEVSQNRIKSIALIHETLYQSENLAKIDFSSYIRKLTTHLLSLYRREEKKLKLDLEVQKVFLDINKAIPCGLIINELVSNSLKHAFPKGTEGRISIRLSSDNGSFTLVVQDSGVGMPEEFALGKTDSLGLQIVNDLVQQLEGTLHLDQDFGTCFTITWK